LVVLVLLPFRLAAASADAQALHDRADTMLANYFRTETKTLSDGCLTDVHSLVDWQSRRETLRQQLFEMLSLSPLPPRTELRPVVTGRLDQEQFTVENLHFQSMPGLYVTANLYLPKGLAKPAPAVLYVCGHAYVMTNGVSYGNKTAYQHHGAWFARNGYVCLIIDTVQLGEIQGIHHGTYREGMWWWNSRGYSSAGVEAWDCIRALDYLQSRPEVDGSRLGVTGRSGGGAYSWWVSALDERINVAAPVAGITDLQNHVVDGTVEGHCDCMFMVNTYRWDYPMVAALVAPRPLLIGNSDKDSIFPLDGVVRLHAKVAKIYELYGATNHLGLLITEGPHKDTQDLQLPVFRWFNRHLKGEDPIIEMAPTPVFTAQRLKVFAQLPSDERTSKIHESFVPLAQVPLAPTNASDWAAQRERWQADLLGRVFRGWPKETAPMQLVSREQGRGDEAELDIYEFRTEHDVELRLYVVHRAPASNAVRLDICDAPQFRRWIASARQRFPDALKDEATVLGLEADSSAATLPMQADAEVCFAPRGIGLSAWSANDRKQIQIRRRFMLLGQTLDGMRVWDIRRAIQALRSIDEFSSLPIEVRAEGQIAVNTLYAAIFEPAGKLVLRDLPVSHRQGPDYLNVLRFLDIPEAIALAADRWRVELLGTSPAPWSYPLAVAANLGWGEERLKISP
jgi:dienelactone hydrolase